MFVGAKMAFRKLVVFLLWLLSCSSFGCSIVNTGDAPDWEKNAKNEPISYLVSLSEIYLATAIEKNTNENKIVSFKFRVDETIRGGEKEFFQLEGIDLDYGKHNFTTSFHDSAGDHETPEFWSFKRSNIGSLGGCTNRGLFRLGMQYLIFVNEEAIPRSFEPIRSDSDLWLRSVKEVVEYFEVMDRVYKQYESQ